jgi:hypothetical protein
MTPRAREMMERAKEKKAAHSAFEAILFLSHLLTNFAKLRL